MPDPSPPPVSKRDLLSVVDLSVAEVTHLLERSAWFKQARHQGVAYRPLEGKGLGLLFQKSSTRTRVAFEVAMFQLGGYAIFLEPQVTQLGRGETLADSARVLSRYLDGIVIRTYAHQEAEEWARHASVPVINGLTDLLHPCQVLSDIFTIREYLGGYVGCQVAYVGDGNNMANSWLLAAAQLGIHLSLACPRGYEPEPSIWRQARELAAVSGSRLEVVQDPYAAVDGADIIYTDVWTSMGQEGERQERLRVFQPYQVNAALLKAAKPGVLVMHCLPAHRGEEITAEVMESSRSIVFDQAENRLHVHKAILENLLDPANGGEAGRDLA